MTEPLSNGIKMVQENLEKGPETLELENLVRNGVIEKIANSVDHPSLKDIWPQILFSMLAMSIAFQTGVQAGFSSIALPDLQRDPNIKHFSKEEASWIASLTTLSGPIGGLLAGPLMDAIGRKNACILTNFPFILSWLFTYSVKESVWPLYVARLIAGCGGGMLSAASVFTSEICHPDYRGMMLCLIGVFVSLGTMVNFVLGSFWHWKTTAIFYGVLSCVSFCGTLYLPESPCWLVSFKPSKKRYEKALKQLSRLYTSPLVYENESKKVLEMYLTSREFNSTSSIKISQGDWLSRLTRRLKMFTQRSVYAPMFILVLLFVFQEFCGVFVIMFYSINLFQGIGSNFGFGINEYSVNIIMGIIRFSMTILTTFLLMRVGRRSLMLVSSIGMAVSMLTAAILSSLSGSQKLHFSKLVIPVDATAPPAVQDDPVNLVTIVALLLFVLFASLGFLNIPWILMSELIPTQAKGLGNGFIMSFALLTMFGVLKTAPYLLDFISLSSLFYIFTGVCLSSILYIYLYIPETLGKSFLEIENIFKKSPK